MELTYFPILSFLLSDFLGVFSKLVSAGALPEDILLSWESIGGHDLLIFFISKHYVIAVCHTPIRMRKMIIASMQLRKYE
jgi:hypothetical protein